MCPGPWPMECCAERKHQTCATQENGSPARRPRLGWEGECPRSCPFASVPCFAFYPREKDRRENSPCVYFQRLKSSNSPSVHAGCGSPLLRGISAVNKSRLLSETQSATDTVAESSAENPEWIPSRSPHRCVFMSLSWVSVIGCRV